MAKRDIGSWIGGKIHYGELPTNIRRNKDGTERSEPAAHATRWQNRRPICPYGCGEEGELVEIIVKDGKSLGIYKDSEQLLFTADLQMAPKPTGRTIKIGPDGEPQFVEEDSQNG